ncbi:hypothetical protein [Lactobacillus jensenii]|uniref:hypothetical protein n=1 Tax=Lactobacillus jensenii TaxID=109790 RepID=UPI0029C5CB25|nr:hypothetical protein [Lactobacillus jensenii]MDX5103558.1 hypothetical protein [Lactobacillus jensenii]MDX5115452.1 hypothetical protein [Lactobacillus jensenii]
MSDVPEKKCKMCNKDLTKSDCIYTDIDHHIFCSIECIGGWHVSEKFESWNEYKGYYFS